ncbi:MAG: helix-turn-helix domain-containing protein [Firmicutes bacterium]|nr:helix-turn-helix domain-containing protein [Bacillota bacterium]MDH7494513.1 helix-turn-helix domain-containing protein [Bacillota bacterium]
MDGGFEHTGGRIRRLRRLRRMTQEDLAELAGLHVSYVGQLERGQRTPSVKTLDAIAKALQVDPALLVKSLGDDESPVEDLLTLVAGASPEQVQLITRIAETVLSSGYRLETRARNERSSDLPANTPDDKPAK